MKRELEGGWFQWMEMPLPAVLTIQSGINKLRYATLMGIKEAKNKEVKPPCPPTAARARQRIVSIYVPEKYQSDSHQATSCLPKGSPAEHVRVLVRRSSSVRGARGFT